MNQLLRAMVGLRRLVTPSLAFTFLVVVALLGIEIIGRQSTSDLHDLLGMVAVVVLTMLVLARHRHSPLPWVIGLSEWIGRLGPVLKQAAFQIGIDLRGRPAVRRGYPPVVVYLACVLIVALAIFGSFPEFFPHGVRDAGIRVFYLGYLALLAAGWLSLVAAILLAGFLPWAMIHDAWVAAHRGPGPRSRRPEFFSAALYFAFWILLGIILPPVIAPTLSVVFLTAYIVFTGIAGRGDVQFLWRPRDSIQVRCLTWGRWVACECTLIALALLALCLGACGGMIADAASVPDSMPLTTFLGLTLTWLTPGLLAALFIQMVLGRLRDPARVSRPVAHVSGSTGNASREIIQRLFAERGWRVRFAPQKPGPLDVAFEIVEEPLSAEKAESRWPLAILAEDIWRPGFFVRLERRDEIQKRRKFLAGLERLLKSMVPSRRSGNGAWLAPHFWFIHGLIRDSARGQGDDDFDLGDDAILSNAKGPPFARIFPRPVRHHIYKILRAAQVDLIFIEDGLSFKKLRRVLRVLFEVYDKYHGRRAAEEIDFRGLPGTRVLIHDYQFDEPFKSNLYPEPKYDFLGRARILHVFRDRNEDEELIEPPFDITSRPVPVGMFG